MGKLIQEAVDLGAECFEIIGPATEVGHVLAQFAPGLLDRIAPGGIGRHGDDLDRLDFELRTARACSDVPVGA